MRKNRNTISDKKGSIRLNSPLYLLIMLTWVLPCRDVDVSHFRVIPPWNTQRPIRWKFCRVLNVIQPQDISAAIRVTSTEEGDG